jgi:hypothetical protein
MLFLKHRLNHDDIFLSPIHWLQEKTEGGFLFSLLNIRGVSYFHLPDIHSICGFRSALPTLHSLVWQTILGLLLIFSFGMSPAQAWTAVGPQTNIAESTLTSGGWTQCWSGTYDGSAAISTVLSNCNGAHLLMGCRPAGNSTFTLLAHAPRADVIFDTGYNTNITHIANGTAWYFHSTNNSTYKSWGFALAGDSVLKSTCDTTTSPNSDKRMCMHTINGNIHSGWRCGINTGLDNSQTWERVIFHSGIPDNPNSNPVITGSSSITMSKNGSPTAFNLTLNASDAEGDTLTWSINNPASKGIASVSGTGTSKTIIYNPNTSYTGLDSFNVQVSDGNGGMDTITVNVNITNNAPVASGGSFSTNEDTSLSKILPASDANSDSLTYSIVTNPSKGSVNFISNVFFYTPNNDYNGSDSFTYKVNDGTTDSTPPGTITITVNPTNDAPIFTSHPITSVKANEKYSYTLAATDVDGTTPNFSVSEEKPTWLTLSGAILSGTPNNNQIGTYNVSLETTDGSLTDTQTFTITVVSTNNTPVANSASFIIAENTPLSSSLSAYDDNGDSLTYTIVTQGSKGTTTINTSTGAFTYSPNTNADGTDNFTYRVHDGVVFSNTATITINIAVVADIPSITNATTNEDTLTPIGVIITNSDTDVTYFKITNIIGGTLYKSNGSTIVSNGTFVSKAEGIAGLKFLPSANLNSSDGNGSFTVRSSTTSDNNGLGGDAASATITINPVNDKTNFTASNPPAVIEDAGPQTLSGWITSFNPGPANENSQAVSDYLITGITNPSLFATVPDVDNSGTLTYTPAANTFGTSTFNVKVQDNGGIVNGGIDTSDARTFSITVNTIADVPSVTNTTTNEDTQSTTGLVITDNGDTSVSHFRMTNIIGGTLYKNNGSTTINNNDFITEAEGNAGLKFTPATNAITGGNFGIQSSINNNDSGLGGNVVTATITVNPVNDKPNFTASSPPAVIEDAGLQTLSGWITSFSPGPANENSQAVSDYLITGITNPSLFATNPDVDNSGTLTYTPAANTFGTSTFNVKVQDNGGIVNSGVDTSDARTFTITVNTIADVPSVTNTTTNEDTQSTTGLVIKDNGDTSVSHFKITNIVGGTLYQNNGSTTINNNNFITEAEGNAGLKFTPATNAIAGGNFGIQSSITNNDSGLGGNVVTATITVNPVNDIPSFTAGNPPVIVEDAGLQTITGWTTSFIPGGASDENGQTVNRYIVENVSVPALFSLVPAIDNSGNLTYTPAADVFGTSTFDVKVQDSGGTANGGVDTSIVKTFTIKVNSVNDQPTFITTGHPPAVNENVGSQTISSWVTSHNVGPNIINGDESAQTVSYIVSNVTNSSLFATSPSVDTSGTLTYTLADNTFGSSNFDVVIRDNGGTTNGGINTSVVQTFSITVGTIANTPTVTGATTDEDVLNDSGLVILVNTADSFEVTHFKITNITNGTLYHSNGFTPINDGDFITYIQGHSGLRFLSLPDSLVEGNFVNTGRFDIQASTSANDTGLGGNPTTAIITINPIADTPSVTNTNAEEHQQSTDGLVISRNEVDDIEVTHFKITNIKEGTLYQNDGTTEILADTFITFEEGNAGNAAGLKFTPAGINNGTFDIQASLSDNDSGLGGDVITATINLDLTNDPPVLSEIGDFLKPFYGLVDGLVIFTAEATDPDAPAQNLRFSLSGDVPIGATINPITGEFSWIPSEAGEFTFTVIVTDDGQNPENLFASEEITITLTKAPIIDFIGDQTVPVEIPLTFIVRAVHHHTLTFSLENAPADATIDPETGKFEWTPMEEGVYTATIVVTEFAGLFSKETITITASMNTPPVLEALEKQMITVGELLNFTVIATDQQDNTLLYQIENAPAGAAIHPNTGKLTWVPMNSGPYNLTVNVTETDGDPINLSISGELEIYVNAYPILATIKNRGVAMNELLEFNIYATHAEDHPLTYELVDAPSGATINSETGEVAWTPTEEGDYEMIVKVTETVGGLSDETKIMINVSDNTSPVMEPIGNQTLPLNRFFEYQVQVTDAQDNQLLYTLEEAPEDVIIHPLEGLMTWIPNEIGTFPVNVVVTEIDGLPNNLSVNERIELVVNTDPAFEPIENQTTAMGNTLTFQTEAFHPLGNALVFSLTGAPDGASINPETGEFSFTPSQAGTFDIMFTVADQTNEEFTDTELVTITVKKVPTELALKLSSNTVLLRKALGVGGNLFKNYTTTASLNGLEVQLNITTPLFDQIQLTTQTVSEKGEYHFTDLPVFDQVGEYTFQTTFAGNPFFAEAKSDVQPVLVRNLAGYAILVQGRTADGDGIPSYNKTLNRVYLKLKLRGFEDRDIIYFNYDTNQQDKGITVDDVPSKSTIQRSIKEMQQRLNNEPAPLYIVMVDHGGVDGSFYIDNGDGGKITPSDLSRWLNDLEKGLNEEALAQPRLIVIGSCYSGAFIPALSKTGRIIITSAAADEESFKGPKEPDEIRSGEFFTEAFFAQLAKGKSIREAFELATETTETLTRSGTKDGVDNRFQDTAAQHPLLDDNGDKAASNALSTGMGDGVIAGQLYSGVGAIIVKGGEAVDGPPEFLSVTDTIYLEDTASSTELFATTSNPNRVKDQQVVADIRMPSLAVESDGTEATSGAEISGLTRVFLPNRGDNRFSSNINVFHEAGKYEMMYLVSDSETGEMAPFEHSIVYKNRAGNQPPKPFHLQVPEDESKSETIVIFSWDSTFDPNNDLFTYTLSIAKDPEFNKIIYQEDELTSSMTFLDKKTPIDDPLNDGKPGLRDGTEYFWKVMAIDPYGATAVSEVFSFTTNNTNAPPGIGSLHISSALDFRAINGATISLVDEFGNPLPDPNIYQDRGNYNMLLPRGRRLARIRVAGYEDQEIDLDTIQGTTRLNVKLIPVGGIPVKPGKLQFALDKASVAENQETISLLVKRVDGSDGKVSINYRSDDGTAIDESDYLGSQGTLTWADKENLSKRITIDIQNDIEQEPDKKFKVILYVPTGGATLGNVQEISVTITDDDWENDENDELVSQPVLSQIVPFSSIRVPLSLGQGMGISKEGTLYDDIGLKNFFDTRVLFWGGANVKGQDYTTTLFSQPAQGVKILGEIHVDPKHVGQTGDILVIASVFNEVSEVTPLFLMLDNYQQKHVWDGDITTLVGLEEDIILPETQVIEIFHSFLEPGRSHIYFGYRLQEDGFIYFNGQQPIEVWVEKEHEYSLDDYNTILFADVSPNGKLLVTASKDGIARLWDLNTGSRLALLRGHTDTVKTAMFSPDGRQILTASADHTARLWDVATREKLITFQGHTGKIEHATFSTNGQRLITASADKTARLWNANNGKTLFILEGHEQGVEYATFSHDGYRVVTASWDHTAGLWDAETGEEIAVLAGHEDMVEHAAFSPNDQYIVTTSWDKTARLWDAHTGQEILTLTGHRNGVSYAAFSPDGEYIVTTSWDNSARLWEAKTGEAVWVREHQAGVHHAAFSPNGQMIVTGSNDHTVRLWKTTTGQPLKTLQGHEGNVWHVGFSPDGERVFSASWDNTVRVWEVESGEVVMVLKD